MGKKLNLILSCLILVIGYIVYLEIEFDIEVIELDPVTDAKCLDGSNYKFQFIKGKAEGKNNFLLFFEGGAWCTAKDNSTFLENCHRRSQTELGTNQLNILRRVIFSGYSRLFSNKQEMNPLFYNWNKVLLKYCDGVGYQGYRKDPLMVKDIKIFFRGMNITTSVIDFLVEHKNFTHAHNVIVSGTSAGGLAALYWSNYISLRTKANTSAIADSALFLDIELRDKVSSIFKRTWFEILKHTGEDRDNELLRTYCTDEIELWKCFVPEYFLSKIKVPVLFLNSVYDSWSFGNLLLNKCFFTNSCNDKSSFDFHEKRMLDLAEREIDNTERIQNYPSRTFWLPKAYLHGFIIFTNAWSNESHKVEEINLIDVVNGWYMGNYTNRIFHDKHEKKISEEFLTDIYYYLEYYDLLKYVM